MNLRAFEQSESENWHDNLCDRYKAAKRPREFGISTGALLFCRVLWHRIMPSDGLRPYGDSALQTSRAKRKRHRENQCQPGCAQITFKVIA